MHVLTAPKLHELRSKLDKVLRDNGLYDRLREVVDGDEAAAAEVGEINSATETQQMSDRERRETAQAPSAAAPDNDAVVHDVLQVHTA